MINDELREEFEIFFWKIIICTVLGFIGLGALIYFLFLREITL